MFTKKLKKALGSIFSSILLWVTFGIFSISKVEAKVELTPQPSPAAQVGSEERELVEALKSKVQADYRANINNYEASSHPGQTGPVG